MSKKVVIVAGGSVNEVLLKEELAAGYDLLIGADSGGEAIIRNGFIPDVLVGDFDSLAGNALREIREQGTEVFSYPVEKDWTDLELAVRHAVKRGGKRFSIFGSLGGRLDHTLGNLSLLYTVRKLGANAVLIGLKESVRLIGSGESIILSPYTGQPSAFFSVIPLFPGVTGLTIKGAKYPLDRVRLNYGSTRGIHNEFTGQEVEISVREGYVYVIVAW